MFAHWICYDWSLDERSLQMSSKFSERFWVDAVSSILYSDVSQGTKGDTKVSTDLGVVKANKREDTVEVAVPTAEKDINTAYEDAIHVLSTKPPKEEKKVDAATDQEDYYCTFRTMCVASPPILVVIDDPFLLCSVLLAWVLSNVSCWLSIYLFMREDLTTCHSLSRRCWSL
jgi:hypothetical protein